MEAADILGALQARIATLPGGRDLEGRPLLLVSVPSEGQTCNRDQVQLVLRYFLSIFSAETRRQGLFVLVDAQRSAWRIARAVMRQVNLALGAEVAAIVVLRPEAFWDKQRVDNCAKSHKDGEPVYIPASRLQKYVDVSQLPEELGGTWTYNHNQWIQDRIYVEAFTRDAEGAVADLEKLRQRLTRFRSGVRVSSVEEALSFNRELFENTKDLAHKVLQAGKEVVQRVEDSRQDAVDTRQRVERLLHQITTKRATMEEAWLDLEKSYVDARELTSLEDGVTRVTDWILGPAEALLNGRQQQVGFDVISAEELRQEHEALELQCTETYGHYAELLHKIDTLPRYNIALPDDLKSQRDFMDFVCRSFATRLERRRNVLITSLRFFRLVSEYFERTNEVLESLYKCDNVEDLENAEIVLMELQDTQDSIELVEREVMKEGEKLADILSMPVKDALGRDVDVNYEGDIVHVLGLLEATRARKDVFVDSVELHKLTLAQAAHIRQYEADAAQAGQWLDDLFQVMLKEHMHVGCNVFEIQCQKEEHQTFQETAKGTYEYGCQLLSAALALRQSCKLPVDGNSLLLQSLWRSWKRLQAVGQEQMTRLRVSAVFHRSVEEHCEQLRELMTAVRAVCDAEDQNKRRTRIHKFLMARERLLLEVGRMVRLGRLLRSRLREPLCPEQKSTESGGGVNATAVEAISGKLAEVTNLAEQLDATLCGAAQHDVGHNIRRILDGTASSTPEEWYSNMKTAPKVPGSSTSTGTGAEDSKSDDEFVTASECTCTPPSRSSSFHTASDGASPWWEVDPLSDAEADTATGRQPQEKAVVKTTTQVTKEMVMHEVTETTRLKLTHGDTLGVTSFLLTTERSEQKHPMSGPEVPQACAEQEPLLTQLKESREWLQLKVLEVNPELTKLGASLQEAAELQRAHDDVLLQLQNKQSPVEELLKQADQLISTQKTRAEVYAAMAESLGLAWKDVNAHLEQRKSILELNVAYQSRAEECLDRMRVLEMACNEEMLPVEIDAVKELLAKLHDFKRSVLEALMPALQHGKMLIEKLKEIATEGTLDSRPDNIKVAADCAISQVEHWLETLHDRRRLLEIAWQSRKTQLEHCLKLTLLASDLKDLEDILTVRKEAQTSDHLGDSTASAELLLHEHKKLLPEAKELQERALKITKATEELITPGHFAAEQATAKAYSILNLSSEYLEAIEQRETLLSRAILFFRSAHTALTKLDQLEVQLKAPNLPASSPQVIELHSQIAKSLDEITAPSLQEGYSLLELIGRGSPGAEGVKRMVDEIENRKLHLGELCTAHREENVRLSQAYTSFLEKQNELFSWLVSIAEAFLQGHQDMGSVLAMAKDFLELHHQLLNDLQKKGVEINALLLTLPPILEHLDDSQREDVDQKVDALHSHWLNLKSMLETRIDLAVVYVRFHTLAVQLANDFDAVEEEFKKTSDVTNEETIRLIEQKWLSLQQLYGQLKSVGKNFLEDASQVQDPHLDIKRASLCVETLLEHFGGRQFTISESWQTWQTSITVEREFKVQWETYVIESKKTVDWVSKIDVQLYPVLTTDTTSSKAVAHELEEKLQVVVPEVKKAQAEVELRIKALESLAQKGGTQEQKEELVEKLLELHNKLQAIITDYQILLQMLIAFFKNLAELEKTIENLQSQYKMTHLPKAAAEVDLLLKEHDASCQAVLEMFKFTHNESEQIISRIKKQEPESVAQHDIDRVTVMLQMKQQAWETAWAERKLQLEQHQQLCQFDSDLHQINSSLSDLSAQLGAIRGQYGESLASAKATSVAFVYFEKTIELLELRIQTFMKTAEEMLSSEHGSSSHIERELKQLQERWAAFHRQVQESRRLIDLSIQYFQLVEEAEEWFREGSKLLLTIARKSTTVRLPEEATQLLNEVEYFLKPGETRQDERIRKISSLAVELYGEEKSKQVTLVMHENKEMLESFTVISEELTTLAKNLRAAEEERERQKREQEEVDASLAAARAEAAAAKAAASAADEARKAAEAAAKALREAAPFLQKAEFAEAIPMPPSEPSGPERPRKSPSPPLKKAKFIEELPQPIAPVFTVPLKDYTIEEGERFTFECRVTGFPMPEVIWYKDGISIQNNPDYRTTFDQGICTLTIEETFTEDSARFTCKAANAAGTAETNATLYVEEAEPEEQLTPPVFTKRLTPATTREGSDFDFKCKVEGNPLPTVQWFKNDVCIDSSPDYVITYNNGEAVLHFEEVYMDDQAEYTCKATNQVGTDSCSTKLNVEPLEPSEIPVFIAPLTNVMARAGQKIKLECEVKGVPIPGISWSHNGKPVKESRDTKMQYLDNKATLVINEAFPKDAGVYIVSAKNIAGEATSACNVSVKGRLPTETSDSELASDMEPVKPSIQLPLKDLSVFEGKRVRLDCIIVGQPEPEVIWYYNNHPVKESTDFKLLFQGDRCSLVIEEAYLEDAGEYKVVAINSGGEASSKCKLTIQSVGETEPATRVQVVEEMEQAGEPPKFIKLLTDILAPEGEKVTFECIVQGDPRPDIKWYLNNEEISASERLQISSDEEGNVHLTIPELLPEDKGVYTVKAFNSCGEAKCFANLIVKTVSSPEIKRKTIELEPPAFKELFADRSVNENETTKFECAITGKPQPHVEWYFNNKVVAGKDFVISSAGEKHTLTVLNVLPNHIGEIACVAENEAGKATCLAHLSVIEKPSTNIIVPLENNISQHQESLVTMKRSMIVQSSKTTSSITTESIEPHVEIHSYRSQTEESREQVDDKPPKEVKRQKVEEFHKVDQGQPVVREQTFVKVVNGVKDSQESASPQQIASPKVTRKSIAPRFVTPLNGKIVDQGADVVLEGIIDGYPQPVVSWYKNGQDLSPKEGLITISWELNRARLELKNVGIKDAGRYTCKAANNVGTASSTADVVVKKTIFPPVFGRRLQAQAAKIGERVVMGAEVTGTPDPVITWYKDGKPIAGAVPGGPFRTIIQGNSYSLIIEKAEPSHSGKYTIKAVNAGGEAQCIADFLVLEPEPQQYAQEPNLEMVTRVVFKDMKEERIQTDSQQHQTTSEKIVQHQLPEKVKPLTTESGTSPIPVSPQRTSPLTTTTESVLLTETTKTEKHMSIKIERTPSPSFPRAVDAPSKEDTHREVQIPVNIERQEDTKPKEDKLKDIEKSKEIKKPEEYTIPIIIETKKPEEDKPKEINLPIINQLEERNYEEMRQTKVQVKQIEIKKAKEMDVPLTFYDPVLIPEMDRVTKVKIPVTVEKSDVEEHKEIWVPVVIEREENVKPEAIKDLEPPEAVIPMEVEVKEEIVKEEEEVEEEEVTEEGVQNQSISKQSAYEFFMSKLQNGHDEIKDKPLKEPDPILANTSVKDNITQFQEYIASKKIDSPPAPLQQLEPITPFMEQPSRESPSIFPKKDDVSTHTTDLSSSYIHREQSNIIKSSTSYVTHHITHQHTSSTSSSIEEFNLQPEPPPEICFIPKSEVAGKLRLDMPTRVKQLEESHRVLSPVEIPSGAIKIFPTPDETKPLATVQKPPVQKPVEEIMKKEVVEEVSVEKKVHLPGTGDWTYRHISHAPAQQSVQSPQPAPKAESPVVSKSYERDEKKEIEIVTPPIPFRQTSEHLNIQRDFEVQRPMSPKPSAQGLAMEKLWASRRTPEPEIVSLPAEPIKRPVTPQPAPPSPMKTHFQESSSISAFSSYEVKDIRRAASPRPSAEGVAMEKLWTPQKPQEPEPVISRPVSRGPQGFTKAMSPKPSVEGLAMDKIWAHKNPDVALKKTWPPPQPSEEKPVIPWAAKGSKEKVWPPPEPALETPEKVTQIPSEIVKAPTPPQKEEKLKHTVEQERYSTTTETQIQESSWRKQHTQNISSPQVETLISPQKPSPVPQHYVAETTVVHSSALLESNICTSEVTTTEHIKKISEHKEEVLSNFESFKSQIPENEKPPSPPVIEERTLKPSQAKQVWPPVSKEEYEPKPPALPKTTIPRRETPSRPQSSVEEHVFEPIIEPGPPPEIGFAPPPPVERRQSYVESIEQDLEKDLEKEPSRHLVGAVRTIPPPPQKEKSVPPPPLPSKEKAVAPPLPPKQKVLDSKPQITSQAPKPEIKKPVIAGKPFERFPDLEAFPFIPEPEVSKPAKCAPPPKPSKFVKGEFAESDYESDLELIHIPPKWRPYESDTEEKFCYRKVLPPTAKHRTRPHSTEPEPLPPSKFDKPPQFEGPPRPAIDKVQITKKETHEVKTELTKVSTKTEIKTEKKKHHHHHHHHHQESKKKHSPPALKPGSPPIYIQPSASPAVKQDEKSQDNKKHEIPVKTKPESPKSKPKQPRNEVPESGYMADTDEPIYLRQQQQQQQQQQKFSHHRHEEISRTNIEQTTVITSQSMTQQQKSTPIKPHPSPKFHHKHSEQKAEKKTTVTSTTTPVKQKELTMVKTIPVKETPAQPALEPFPFKVEPQKPVAKRTLYPPPPSPSKFVKGEFRESDYESDYEGKIPPKWHPHDSDADVPTYKPVRPLLTPGGTRIQSRASAELRSPTPPTEFDQPPNFGGPPRPKFEPIEKAAPTVKLQEILKPAEKSHKVYKPTPLTPRAPSPIELIVATPAVKEPELKPGTPPEMGYIPPPSSYPNATQTETSKIMKFAESTEHSHRVVSVQQTTRVIKFGETEKKRMQFESKTEPSPFKPEPVKPHKKTTLPPPTTPKRFTPGEFRESDYESDYEGIRIKPKWAPSGSDTDEPQYRKVKPPSMTRSSSVPAKSSVPVSTPMEFDTQPPTMPTPVTTITKEEQDAEYRRLKRVEEMRKRFSERTTSSQSSAITKSQTIVASPKKQDVILQPGEPPEFGFVAIPPEAACVATKHLNEMTSTFKSKAQRFVDDIITDVKTAKQNGKPEKVKIAKPEVDGEEPQAYREESRVAQYGTKHIDPDTGLIYFKYDFGYEFGIVLPGEGKQGGDDKKKKLVSVKSRNEDDIEVPVIHETTKKSDGSKTTPQFRPKKVPYYKGVKWEPVSESEMSEAEGDTPHHKKRYSLPQAPHILIPPMSPLSISPSLPSLSPRYSGHGPYTPGVDSTASPGSSWQGISPNRAQRSQGRGSTPTPPSTPSTPGSTHGTSMSMTQPRKPPTFITPLRDIAVVSGQTARFECIVQAEPPPNILWSKNGRIIENSNSHQIQYRNGVCRLTIPQAFPEDAGTYTCTATNMLGTIGTTGTLQVPGERRSVRV